MKASDLGRRVGARARFTDDAGNDESLASAAVRIHAAALPASCPTFSVPAGRAQVWSGTFAVRRNVNPVTQYTWGYGYWGREQDLPNRTFELGPDLYTIENLVTLTPPSHPLHVVLCSSLAPTAVATLRLHVCGEVYHFADARGRRASGRLDAREYRYEWRNAGLDWSSLHGSTQTVYLTVAGQPATGKPEIAGTAEVGETLSASKGTVADPDGPSGQALTDALSWQWVRVDSDGRSNPVPIPGATSTTYTVTGEDVGKRLRVRASFTDVTGTYEARASDATGTVPTPPGLVVSKRAVSLPEGGSGRYTVRLATVPAGNVTVELAVAGNPDVTVSPRTLTFTAQSWNAAQMVTVTASRDTDTDTDTATLTHTGSGGGYDDASAVEIAVEVYDIDGAGTRGAVRLGGASGVSGLGRVEVSYHGQWGTVCDDRQRLGNLTPVLACRLAGHAGGQQAPNLNTADFNAGSKMPIWLNDVLCRPGGRGERVGDTPRPVPERRGGVGPQGGRGVHPPRGPLGAVRGYALGRSGAGVGAEALGG